ncbi:MAG: 2'-5' RNA ligase family protein [Chitinophagaceae bacterium]|nr:MAG: 2'-5' RNA ligase family protein [Chitinophagaceae bacterium]
MHMYYAALVLPPELNERILPMKQWMREHYGCKVGLKSPAHITLLPPFWMNPGLENELRADMNNFCATQTAFNICTSGFSAFRPRTLFIDVVVDEPLKSLKRACDAWFRPLEQYGIKIENRPFHPHITIATRDLHKAAFAEAWMHFKDQEFDECWAATEVSILKHNGQRWDVWGRSPLSRES